MASTYYLGTFSNGRLASRKSNRDDFTHAAIVPTAWAGKLAAFSTSAQGARRNAEAAQKKAEKARKAQAQQAETETASPANAARTPAGVLKP